MQNIDFTPWPNYSTEEAEIVKNVLLSNKVNYWTGDHGKKFEQEFAKWSGTKYAIALANGTVALDVALECLGIGKGDEVIVTSRTFIASASSIVTAGASPVFTDINIDTQNITAKTIQAVITPSTKAIICVHLAGWPCEMDEIMTLAEQHNLLVIEDCAQAHGAKYKGKPVGSIGHVGAWSFCQDKIMTTGGEGGMVTTNDKSLWLKMWAFKDHGKSWEAVFEHEHPPGFRWLHEHFGTNGRMTEMQAAIGRYQLNKMPKWFSSRNNNAKRIWDATAKLRGLRTPEIPNHIEHAAYKCYVFIEQSELKSSWNRDKIMNEINKEGVPCFSGSCSEVYLEKAFDHTSYKPETRLENSKELGETSLMFLVHPSLSDQAIDKTIEVVKQVMSRAAN